MPHEDVPYIDPPNDGDYISASINGSLLIKLVGGPLDGSQNFWSFDEVPASLITPTIPGREVQYKRRNEEETGVWYFEFDDYVRPQAQDDVVRVV